MLEQVTKNKLWQSLRIKCRKKIDTYRAVRPSLFRPAQEHDVGWLDVKNTYESPSESEEKKHRGLNVKSH